MMNHFPTDLELELLAEKRETNRRWKVLQPFEYYSKKAGCTITVPCGFITDLASVPRVPIIYFLFGNTVIEAAVIHDYLYSPPKKVRRALADAILREASIASGVSVWRAYGIWLGVRIAGWLFFNKK